MTLHTDFHKANIAMLFADMQKLATNPKKAANFDYRDYDTCLWGMGHRFGRLSSVIDDPNQALTGLNDNRFVKDASIEAFGEHFHIAIINGIKTLLGKPSTYPLYGHDGLTECLPAIDAYMQEHSIPREPGSEDNSPITNLRIKVKAEQDTISNAVANASSQIDNVLAAIEALEAANLAAHAAIKEYYTATNEAPPAHMFLYQDVYNSIPKLLKAAKAAPKK